MSEMDRLIAAADGGIWPGADMHDALGTDRRGELAYAAYHGSLDAALALHDALLPGWKVAGLHQEDRGLWWAELREGFITSYSHVVVAPHSFDAPTPARAWLLAILRAYRQQRESGE